MKNMLNILKSMNTVNKRVFLWYILSISIIFIEWLINSQLDFNVYFHPFISMFINILLFIDLFFIPITFLSIDIFKKQKLMIIKFFQIILSMIGIGVLSIIIVFIFSIFNKSVFHMDTVDIDFHNNKIYVENRVWLESSHHVEVYQTENMFFVRLVDHYQL